MPTPKKNGRLHLDFEMWTPNLPWLTRHGRPAWRRLSVLSRGGFQRGQVHLDHPHHGLHGFRMTDQFADIAWHNLPAQAEAICKPAAGHGFAAFDQLAPVVVDLFLGVAADEEREGGIELMRGAAVEKDHFLALKLDRDRGNLAHGPGTDAFGTQLIELACVREDAQVKLGGFFGVVIEPEEWRKFVHGWHGTRRNVTSDKPGFTGLIWAAGVATKYPIASICGECHEDCSCDQVW